VWWRPSATTGATAPEVSTAAESIIDDVLDNVEVGIFVLDEDCDVVYINGTAERYFGLDREGVRGRDKRQLVDEYITSVVAEPDSFAERVLATYEDNTYIEQFECRVRTMGEREDRWLEHRSKPIESGTYEGGRVELYYDITDQKHSERARQTNRVEFESLVDAVEEYAIFTLDTEGCIQTWNSGAEQIKGYDADEIIGEHFSTFYPEEDRQAGIPERNLTTAAAQGSVEGEGWRVRADGSWFWADVTITAIRDDDGDLEGYAKVTRDLTERKQAESERELLYETTSDIAEAESFEAGLESALRDICEVTGWEYAEAWLPTEQGELWRADADYYAEEVAEFAAFSEGYTLPAGEGLPGRVYETGEFEWAADLTTGSPEWYPRLGKALDVGMKSAFGIPVVADEDVVAVLTFVTRTARETDERLVDLVSSVASELGELVARRQVEADLERERQLMDRIFETAPIGICVFGPDQQMRRANERLEDVLGLAGDDATTYSAGDVTLLGPDGEPLAFCETPAGRAFETGEAVFNEEVEVVAPDSPRRWLSVNAVPFTDEDGEITRVVATTTDVTRLKEQAERLERQRDELEAELGDIFTRIDDAFYALDEELRFEYVNDRAEEIVGYSEAELLGRSVWEVFSVDEDDPLREKFGEAMSSQTATRFERFSEQLGIWEAVRVYPSESGLSVYFTDITERKEREQKLQDRIRQGEVVTELGRRALESQDLDALMAQAAERVAETLGTDYCKVLDLDEDAEELRLRQGVGWDEGVVGSATVSAVEDDSQAAYTLKTEGPVIVTDLTDESRFSGPDLLTDHHVRGGISTIIGSTTQPWGILGTHGTEPRTFSEHDATFVQAVANILASAVDRYSREQTLVQQREQLAVLNSLNEVARDIIRAVIGQSTREEIESTVCDRLAATDSYLFAWTGEVDTATRTVELRTESGVEGYLDGITISVDPDDEHSQGPTGRAFRTGEIQVTHDIDTDPKYEPWRDHSDQYGVRSSAAVPLVHEGTVYGTLNVYTDRTAAFTGQEREVVEQLGAVVGHAIAATNQKQALQSDELVELDFQVRDVFGLYDLTTGIEGRVTLDHAVPVGDEEFLVYGTAPPDTMDALGSVVEAVPHWDSVAVRSEGDPTDFEIRMTDPPVLSVLASLGGYVDDAVIEDGDLEMTVHVAPSVDVRQVIDVIQDAYPGAEMVRRQQIDRVHDDPKRLQRRLAAELTERQRTALELAYHAGFFEWPRDASGEDVADSMGVAPPTFHQHLRKAEQEIFDSVFSSSTQNTG